MGKRVYKVERVISHCIECPNHYHCDFDEAYGGRCRLVQSKGINYLHKSVPSEFDIPDWCPLPKVED